MNTESKSSLQKLSRRSEKLGFKKKVHKRNRSIEIIQSGKENRIMKIKQTPETFRALSNTNNCITEVPKGEEGRRVLM